MAYFDYYRANPNWASSQWQSMAPPAPAFQPQPSWGGPDYYRAMAGGGYDTGLYDYAQNRLQGLGTSGLANAAPSLVEAKLMHRRAYGGLGDILTMAPMEIGAAAAYEVWRNWRYNYGVLAQPLSGDAMRQREALVGLAIGEATRLWQYTQRVGDNTGRLAAVETAALAAARIFDQGNSILMSSGGAYGNVGTGMGMGAGGMGAGGMGAISPALSGSGLAGGALGSGAGGMGFGGGVAGSGMASPAPPLVRRRSLSVGAAPGGLGYGAGGYSGMPNSGLGPAGGYAGMANSGLGGAGMGNTGLGGAGMYSGAGMANSGLAAGGYAGGMANSGLAAGGYGGGMANPGLAAGGYTGGMANTGLGGAGMYGGADGLLGAGGGAGAGIQRPLSAGGYASSAGMGYGPGEPGETSIMRHERHRAERAAERAERAALKGVRYEDGYRPGRAYDDYDIEYGRGGLGDGYGAGGGYGGGGGYGDGYGGYGRRYGRHGRRRHRLAREAEGYAMDALGGGSDGYGGGYGRYGGGIY
ncbi:uncharacterized protein FOMMEDRAFT_22411 [Fomitiporia mediterranea MF3/22]|uniref:uncharacterized protein n=1 Tax=Fomitiporia mediterranea (strain MF3/22) TaxID=694068 RepID=UPI0004407B03|nr:uncharacterized protein FOMMEDRAFT_22411 [Fomitiporia mediterranea MF3/22]EJD00667.1 hypothetical protein FOMMEDRAFT_22411 [Fomitiporia mediterranea MF3/22]